MNTIEIKNLTKVIHDKNIITDLSVDIKKGEVFGFLGPNGAGKTTVIRMIVGLISPTNGEIKICGYSIKEDRNLALNKIGAIIETPQMYDYMSGFANLKHYANMHMNISKQRIYQISKDLGIENRLKDKVRTYSLGMKQRLGIAQALLHEPEILILDEPTNGLDPTGIREFRDYIIDLAHQQGMTIFISSHLLSEIELMCDRIGIIKSGKLIEIKDLNDKGSKDLKTYNIKVENANIAYNVLNEEFPTSITNNEYINIKCQEESIPHIISLISNLTRIYSIEENKQTLEDHYFNTIAEEEVKNA